MCVCSSDDMGPKMANEEDSAWKDVLDEAFEEFILFFFPQIHRDVDWPMGFEHLDKELEPILRDAESGKRLADKLVKVHLLSGEPALALIHVEVQGSPEVHFARRMFQYNTRILERYGEEVVSLAILTDERSSFRPSMYERSRWGFDLRMQFPVVKLLDYEAQRGELEASRNPFALVVLAHLDARRARALSPEMAFEAKWKLIRGLYSKGYERENMLRIFKFIDWVLRLPKAMEVELWHRVRAMEGKKTMPYVPTYERYAIEIGIREGREVGRTEGRTEGRVEGRLEGRLEGHAEGKQEGLREGLLEAITCGLRLRFGEPGLELLSALRQVQDADVLRRFHAAVLTVETLDQLRGQMPLS